VSHRSIRILLLAVCGGLAATQSGCAGREQAAPEASPLLALLRAQPQRFGPVLDDPVRHRIQIIYTRIDRDSDGRPVFTDFAFRTNPDEYFYPASTVKLPVALLALERLHAIGVPADTPMLTDADGPGQTPAHNHPRAPAGVPSVAHYVREIFAVSDNDAFNRLYELLGQEGLQQALHARGLNGTRILHRLALPLPLDANRQTNPVRFERDGVPLYAQPGQRSSLDLVAGRPIPLGRGEILDGRLVAGPKDFADKNAYPLAELHETVRRVVFPESVPPSQRFDLAAEDRAMVLQAMGRTPRETGIPAWSGHPDGFVKYLVLGGTAAEHPVELRIFNKVGKAFGFLTDAAYVVDFATGAEFLLSATVYVNGNEVFNDDVYEYDTLGLPFLAELGAAVLEMERARPREHQPDLAPLRALFDR